MPDLALVRARENDPATMSDAQARSEQIYARLSSALLTSLSNAALREKQPLKKIVWLRRLADQLGPATQGIAPCRDGCAHCCHTPVLLSRVEAEVIAKETGATLQTPRDRSMMNRTNRAYIGVPCPFLRESRCSIYASRPFVCRTHYNLDADNLLCRLIPGEPVKVPYLDHKPFDEVHVSALGKKALQFFDIRDFFGVLPNDHNQWKA